MPREVDDRLPPIRAAAGARSGSSDAIDDEERLGQRVGRRGGGCGEPLERRARRAAHMERLALPPAPPPPSVYCRLEVLP